MSLGYLQQKRGQRDWVLGSSAEWPVLRPDGQWSDYLVAKELQKKNIETMACVSFASLNVIETIIYLQTGKEKNFSDRYTAKMSNTTLNGNFFFNVANSIKNDGVVGEMLWQYVDGWEEYYKDIPAVVLKQAEYSKERYTINYRWVDTDVAAMKEALKYSPLLISVRYSQNNTGEYKILDPDGTTNHAVMCYGYKEGEYWLIMDSYEYGGHLKKYAWDYDFGAAMQYKVIINKEEEPMTSPIKILQKKGEKDVGVWLPITSEAAFKSLAYSFGYEVQMIDGVIDWPKSIQGEFELKE